MPESVVPGRARPLAWPDWKFGCQTGWMTWIGAVGSAVDFEDGGAERCTLGLRVCLGAKMHQRQHV